MARVETFAVGSVRAYEATGPDGSVVTVKNLGPDSCYYATASTVSSGSNDGTLTSGSAMSFAPSKFFVSAGTSNLQVTTPSLQEQPGKGLQNDLIVAPQYQVGSTATLLSTANRGYFARFVPKADFTATVIAFEVTTIANVDDPVDVGIYSAAGARIVSAGATSGKLITTTGVKTVTITGTPLYAGTVYYAAFSYGTVGGTAGTLRTTSSGAAGDLFGATVGTTTQFFMTSAYPLPATATTSGTLSACPIIAVRAS